jgi:hypothetical protein
MSPGSRQEAAERALSGSDAVFAGEVADIDWPLFPLSSGAPMTVTFRVSESWKGPERGLLSVKTPVSGASCGYPFGSGKRYLVYASGASIGEEEGLEVQLCGQTEPLSEAGTDLKALGDGKALPGTSGGPSGLFYLTSRELISAVLATVVAGFAFIGWRLGNR